MKSLSRTIQATALTVAGIGISQPVSAGQGYWHAPYAASSGTECRDSGDDGVFSEWKSGFRRTIERIRKEPFDHYAHNPDDLRRRPICPPYCSPYGGYFEPGWRQMPPGPADLASGAVHSPAPVPGHGTLVPPPAPAAPPSAPAVERNVAPPAAPAPLPPTSPTAVRATPDLADPFQDLRGGPSLSAPATGWTKHDSAF